LSASVGRPVGVDAIVVAAGSSQRMGGVDKLTWRIADRPLLAYAVDAMASAPDVDTVVIVTAADRRDDVAAASWLPAEVRAVVPGGLRRQDSVRAGFDALEEIVPDPAGDRIVLIHDGARPAVSPSLIADIIAAARRYGAAIPVLPLADTVKRVVDERVLETVDRASLSVAQTPQAVRRSLWRRATTDISIDERTWTDEAALLEACTIEVHAVPGDPANIKVTVPDDLSRVAAQLNDRHATAVPARRSGIGIDSHPFGPETPLELGGLTFPNVPRLHGHSDGDVALHALADALLGAAALGDLGRLFPSDRSTPAGIASRTLLASVVERLAEAGWRPSSADVTIVAARPRLAGRLDEMRESIAAILAVGLDRVSVKASTGNLDGSEGAGRTISAFASTTIEAVA
jgi:2-C-methyl-D-erythritol 4-phosphate cytidylyltransferase / 2-C-methyl-D-erythritol 2,4-cyclodiphosphate synthase